MNTGLIIENPSTREKLSVTLTNSAATHSRHMNLLLKNSWSQKNEYSKKTTKYATNNIDIFTNKKQLVKLFIKKISRTFTIFVAATLLSSCILQPEFIGYLTNSDETSHDILTKTNIDSSAVLLRRNQDNLLEMQIGGPKTDGTLSSIVAGQYSIIFTFSTLGKMPPGEPRIFFPLLNSQHFEIKKVTETLSGNSLVLELTADRIGIDLLLTYLTAPSGLQGVVYFGDSLISLPVSAEAFREEFAWAKLYTAKDTIGRTCLGIMNVSEYPFHIWGISLPDGTNKDVNTEIDPLEVIWSCFFSHTIFNPSKISVSKSRHRAVPNKILLNYLNTE